jgi:hypothetical protein
MITYEEIVHLSGLVIFVVLISIHLIKKIVCPKED